METPSAATTVGGGSSTRPPNHKVSFAAVIGARSSKGESANGDIRLNVMDTKKPAIFQGEPALYFSVEELEHSAIPLKFALVAKCAYERPKLDVLKKIYTSAQFHVSQNFTVGVMDSRHLLIRFQEEEDYLTVWMKEYCYVDGKLVRFIKWSPQFRSGIEPSIVPVWINLPGLPLNFFNPKDLSSIGNLLGRVLLVDRPTRNLSRPSLARICVEIDASKKKIHRFWLGMGSASRWQRIVYEKDVFFCSRCQKLGHDEDHCKILNKKPYQKGAVSKTLKPVMESENMVLNNSNKGLKESVPTHIWVAKAFGKTSDADLMKENNNNNITSEVLKQSQQILAVEEHQTEEIIMAGTENMELEISGKVDGSVQPREEGADWIPETSLLAIDNSKIEQSSLLPEFYLDSNPAGGVVCRQHGCSPRSPVAANSETSPNNSDLEDLQVPPISKLSILLQRAQEDSPEEFEPLFDYSHVQPPAFICIDDDCSDSSPVISPKRKKISNPAVEKEEKSCTVVNIDCEEKEEEDWLLPPPKVSNAEQKLKEDSTIKELRLKKQELASLAQSAADVLRAVEESAKRELNSSLQPAVELVADQPSKPHAERVKIIISIQDKDGLKQFRVYMDEKFERLFKMYAEKVKHDLQSLVFCFDGDKITPTATPDGLGMEDNDIIEVHVKSS
ncbi:hypothetical protein HHK36_014929 [Tetracentron sinense]|uniref:Rad60/SUMO-like domain-containing protein n=1 Tax=Tetracentron sinense TaxID=13715 RepID=A0A835DCB9_TETSI|nr:hypothetical protein HHK36_014929 [Tetracentron sinense]